jgi:hypothetical protein
MAALSFLLSFDLRVFVSFSNGGVEAGCEILTSSVALTPHSRAARDAPVA